VSGYTGIRWYYEPVSHTLEQLGKRKPGPDRLADLTAYIEQGEEKLRAARVLRDEDLRALAAKHGKAAAARMAGVSLSTIKLAVGRTR
jgi:hypothetical protein